MQADANSGLVFAAFSFSDSVFAFNYQGTLVGTGVIDEDEPLKRLEVVMGPREAGIRESRRALMERLDGLRRLKRIVVLQGGYVAMQIDSFETDEVGLLTGGKVILAFLADDGRIRNVARVLTDATLIGRDAGGHALLLRYADDSLERYELLELRMMLQP